MRVVPQRAALALAIVFSSVLCQGQRTKLDREAACHDLRPASAGGLLPRDPDVLVLRYLGTSNYEVAYRGKVLLLDAFYDGQRGPSARLIGLKESHITRADAIFVGHPHIDHLADAPSIAKRLGIPLFVAPAGRPILERENVPPALSRYVSGGETIKMDGYTVMTALARHSELDPKTAAQYGEAANMAEPRTPEENAYLATKVFPYNPKSTDPLLDIPTHGTLSYVFVFPGGFKLAFRDSPGAVTEGERELVKKVGGGVDAAIIGYNGFGIQSTVSVTLALAETYHPKVFLPAHQDQLFLGVADVSTTPLFEAFREKLPMTRGVDPLYRTPICINTKDDSVSYDQLTR